MPRSARIVLPGIPHHITHRGNNKQIIFCDANDYIQYLNLLKNYSSKYTDKIHAYCLMPNHIHLVVVPAEENTLALTIGHAHKAYADYINKKYKRCGHLWHERFYSCPLGESHYWKSIKYVERNPVRAKIVTKAENYKWSSASAHINRFDVDNIIDKDLLENFIDSDAWREMLIIPETDYDLYEIRKNTISSKKIGIAIKATNHTTSQQ
jgi:putative transposase